MRPWYVSVAVGVLSYALALFVTWLFVRYCNKKYRKKENFAEWYNIRMKNAIYGALPWMLFFMFLLGQIVAWVI